MRILPRSIEKLIESFEKLPGVGPKTASRLTFYLLHVPQSQLDEFARSLSQLKTATVYCSICSNVGESDPCVICSDNNRDKTKVCVIEQPIDIVPMEKTGKFNGVYHVLHGVIDPLNNIGPDEIRIAELFKRIRKGVITEMILATNPTMEGEATAMYIRNQLASQVSSNGHNAKIMLTRLANGLPIGGDLEYADEVTLGRAIEGRNAY